MIKRILAISIVNAVAVVTHFCIVVKVTSGLVTAETLTGTKEEI